MPNQTFFTKQEVDTAICYFDNAATTKPTEEVVKAIQPFIRDMWQNPSSLYLSSKKVNLAIEQARTDIAKFIGATSHEIYFTSSGSESNCWAIQGFIHKCIKENKQPVIITSKIEHKSIMECVDFAKESRLANVYYIDNDTYGDIDLEHLKHTMEYVNKYNSSSRTLVSIQFANNEIGTIQPIKKIAELVHKYGGALHTDATQVVGHLPIDVNELDVDMLSASAHKFNGLKGSGFLYVREGIKIEPLIYGSQNNGMRGGTENVIGIVAMATALKNCDTSFNDSSPNDKVIKIRNRLIDKISNLSYNIRINNITPTSTVLPSILSVTILENVTAEAILYMLDSADIQVSSGSACNSQSHKPSYVLQAIGFSDRDAIRTLRISINESTTFEQIDKLTDELNKAIKILTS